MRDAFAGDRRRSGTCESTGRQKCNGSIERLPSSFLLFPLLALRLFLQPRRRAFSATRENARKSWDRADRAAVYLRSHSSCTRVPYVRKTRENCAILFPRLRPIGQAKRSRVRARARRNFHRVYYGTCSLYGVADRSYGQRRSVILVVASCRSFLAPRNTQIF